MSAPRAGRSDRYFDGGGHERLAGYARATRRGDTITVSGTTSNDGSGGVLHPGDTGGQTAAALRQALTAVERLGGRADDVVRTRIFLAPGADWRAASEAHVRVFGSVNPANTMLYVHALIPSQDGGDFLVEVELDAVVPADHRG
jgi:enamine deaminase RidA (YjgF/YER057c/UK114 family)